MLTHFDKVWPQQPKLWLILTFLTKILTNFDLPHQNFDSFRPSKLKFRQILTNFDLNNQNFDKFWPSKSKFWLILTFQTKISTNFDKFLPQQPEFWQILTFQMKILTHFDLPNQNFDKFRHQKQKKMTNFYDFLNWLFDQFKCFFFEWMNWNRINN